MFLDKSVIAEPIAHLLPTKIEPVFSVEDVKSTVEKPAEEIPKVDLISEAITDDNSLVNVEDDVINMTVDVNMEESSKI